ncbi:MAG TPA: hypothetical protein VN893_09325 [Bryobacteraceae bacterium]|nr:hypothetical protein [Bryobacteraceae bacterium]
MRDLFTPRRARMGVFWATLLLSLVGAGCVRREGRNADCKWPAETSGRSADPRHLSADAEFAEDLAIRYADIHFGLRTPNASEAYGAQRDRCMGSLFEEIAREHGVPVGRVSGALGQNRADIDVAENMPFALLCCFAAIVLARLLWRRYPPAEHGWIPGAIMALFVSLAFAVGSTMLGELWSPCAESWRIGNGHMSYRADRLWWGGHRPELFAGAVVAFWLAAAATALRMRSNENPATVGAPRAMTWLS